MLDATIASPPRQPWYKTPRTLWGAIVTAIWLIGFGWLSLSSAFPTNGNEWGDWAAGTFAPVAFLWLVLGYFQQGEELRLQVQELNASVHQQKQLAAAAVIAHRPWIGLGAELGDVEYGETGLSLTITLWLENAGQSPAHHILPFVVLSPCAKGTGVTFDETTTAARKTAEGAKNAPLGLTLFPGKREAFPVTTPIGKAELDDILRRSADQKLLYIQVGVCVRYKFANGGEGFTEMLYILWGWDPVKKTRREIGLTAGTLPKHQLTLDVNPVSPALS